jgi:hypothetical protein
LALAMKEKNMEFDDSLSFSWEDCSQVCLFFSISWFTLVSVHAN